MPHCFRLNDWLGLAALNIAIFKAAGLSIQLCFHQGPGDTQLDHRLPHRIGPLLLNFSERRAAVSEPGRHRHRMDQLASKSGPCSDLQPLLPLRPAYQSDHLSRLGRSMTTPRGYERGRDPVAHALQCTPKAGRKTQLICRGPILSEPRDRVVGLGMVSGRSS